MTETSSKETLLNAAVLHWMHDLSAQGIVTTDSELNVVEWNHWTEEHTGKRAHGVIGKNLLELFPELIERRLDRHYKWALEGQVRVLSQALHGYLIPNAERAVETIYRNAKSQAQLVADLLDVSRIISGKLRLDVRPVDLIYIINAAIDSVRPAAEAKGIRLTRCWIRRLVQFPVTLIDCNRLFGTSYQRGQVHSERRSHTSQGPTYRFTRRDRSD